jgi:hypothetical protein
VLRWAVPENGTPVDDSKLPTGARMAFDAAGDPVFLFPDQWSCDFYAERNPGVALSALPVERREEALA